MKTAQQKEIAKKLGNRIAALRKRKSLSQVELAFEADIDLSTLSRLERGILNVTLTILTSIAIALKVELKELFDFELQLKDQKE